jgi:hypothetical protein
LFHVKRLWRRAARTSADFSRLENFIRINAEAGSARYPLAAASLPRSVLFCVLLATLFAQPFALLGAIGVRRSVSELHPSVAKVHSFPMMAVVAEVALLATAGVALETRLQPGARGSLQHICRVLLKPGCPPA